MIGVAPSRREEAAAEQTLRVFLAPAYGALIALSYALGWLFLERAFTPRVLGATVYLALAGMLSAGAALVAAKLLAGRSWSARLAAAASCLLIGTVGLASVMMTLEMVLTHHRLTEIPIRVSVVILGISGAGAFLPSVLTIAAPIILPLRVPLIAFFAVLIARAPR